MVYLAFIYDGNGTRLGSAFVNAEDDIGIGIRIGNLIEPLILAETPQPITSRAIAVVPGIEIPGINRILAEDEERRVFAHSEAMIAMLDGKGESDADTPEGTYQETRRESGSATVH